MSDQPRKVTPAQLGFLAIYNPSLGTTDETLEEQIVYYSSPESRGERNRQQDLSDAKAIQDAIREQSHERLRQIGLAQGMVEFGRSFSEGRSVDSIETEKSRIVLHELEAGWWILAVSPITTRHLQILIVSVYQLDNSAWHDQNTCYQRQSR
jgi:First Longin domain of INTU, CCZ1 and HPS4